MLSQHLIFYDNVVIKNAIFMTSIAILVSIPASMFSYNVNGSFLQIASGLSILITGIGFLKESIFEKAKKISLKYVNRNKNNILYSIIFGIIIGFIAGFFGAGGGLMILFFLIFVFNYSIHRAIGTAIFVMVFIAFFSGVAHLYFIDINIIEVFFAILGGIFGAVLASLYANSISEKKLTKLVGICLILISISMLFKAVILL